MPVVLIILSRKRITQTIWTIYLENKNTNFLVSSVLEPRCKRFSCTPTWENFNLIFGSIHKWKRPYSNKWCNFVHHYLAVKEKLGQISFIYVRKTFEHRGVFWDQKTRFRHQHGHLRTGALTCFCNITKNKCYSTPSTLKYSHWKIGNILIGFLQGLMNSLDYIVVEPKILGRKLAWKPLVIFLQILKRFFLRCSEKSVWVWKDFSHLSLHADNHENEILFDWLFFKVLKEQLSTTNSDRSFFQTPWTSKLRETF